MPADFEEIRFYEIVGAEGDDMGGGARWVGVGWHGNTTCYPRFRISRHLNAPFLILCRCARLLFFSFGRPGRHRVRSPPGMPTPPTTPPFLVMYVRYLQKLAQKSDAEAAALARGQKSSKSSLASALGMKSLGNGIAVSPGGGLGLGPGGAPVGSVDSGVAGFGLSVPRAKVRGRTRVGRYRHRALPANLPHAHVVLVLPCPLHDRIYPLLQRIMYHLSPSTHIPPRPRSPRPRPRKKRKRRASKSSTRTFWRRNGTPCRPIPPPPVQPVGRWVSWWDRRGTRCPSTRLHQHLRLGRVGLGRARRRPSPPCRRTRLLAEVATTGRGTGQGRGTDQGRGQGQGQGLRRGAWRRRPRRRSWRDSTTTSARCCRPSRARAWAKNSP